MVTRCCAEEAAVRTLPGSCWYSNISFTLLRTIATETSCWEDQGLLQNPVTGYLCSGDGQANTAISCTERNKRTETTCRQEIRRKSWDVLPWGSSPESPFSVPRHHISNKGRTNRFTKGILLLLGQDSFEMSWMLLETPAKR